MNETWYVALCLIADYHVTAYWRMANGAEFWWTLVDTSSLLPDRFADEQFLFSEIVSVTIYREAHVGSAVIRCDWTTLKDALRNVPGLRIIPIEDVRPWPSSPPTEAIELAATGA